jgi:hypothetical protein|tara:strand:- start:1272 stop:1454 length:183 start_codon:yes stop_codon:yes gene_type:complete
MNKVTKLSIAVIIVYLILEYTEWFSSGDTRETHTSDVFFDCSPEDPSECKKNKMENLSRY